MIYCFPVPIILDQVDFTELLTTPLSTENMTELTKINESRNKFRTITNEIYLKQQQFGENFSQYKEAADTYLNQNVDLVPNLS